MSRWTKNGFVYKTTSDAIETALFFAGFHDGFVDALVGVLSEEQRVRLLSRLGFTRHPAAETAGEESEET